MATRDPGADFLRAFGRAVRAARAAAGLSQEALGFAAGLDRTYVSGIERGVRNPTLKIIVRIAGALRARPDRLIAAAQAMVDKG